MSDILDSYRHVRRRRTSGPPAFWSAKRIPRWRRWLGGARPFLLLAILVAIWVKFDANLVEPIGPLATEPEPVSSFFTLCDQSRGLTCVIDGDTFKLGGRKIRIIGIDAPETHPARCNREAAMGQAATLLLQRLLNDGQFEMIGRIDEPRDRYGRELKALRRIKADGTYTSIASEMRDSGLAHRYLGGFKTGWC